ncbi:MAG: diaminopimelate epimerase [Candidatus Omnitrophota bacterium]
MKRKIKFTKMVATGNDFVVLEVGPGLKVLNLKLLAKKICDRKYGVGADGLLVLGNSKRADIKMRIFNADGSEAEMCGNGARCAALYIQHPASKIETKAGIIDSLAQKDRVRIRFTVPHSLKLGIPVSINGCHIKTNFINTGVPHAVIFVDGLDKIDVAAIGSQIRYSKEFAPKGTNVDFVEISGNDSINVRTYERGVEDETLACGTGSVASALIFGLLSSDLTHCKINVRTRSGEALRVYFDKKVNSFSNVWLEGKAEIVYKGEYYV